MKKEALLVLLDTIFDEKIKEIKEDFVSVKGERGLRGRPGKSFDFLEHKGEIYSEIQNFILSIKEDLKLKYTDLTDEELKSLRTSPKELKTRINDLFEERKDSLKATFADLTDEQKESLRVVGPRGLRGQRGKPGKDFNFEEHEEKIKSFLPTVEELKFKFSDFSEEELDSLQIKGPRGQRGKPGKDFSFDEHEERIKDLLPKIEELKIKFSDYTEEEKEELKLKFKDLSVEDIQKLKLTFDDLSEEDREELRGPKGPRGQRGKSIKGDTGEKGEKGDKGDKGEPGQRGLPGVTGVQGRRGPQGEEGERAPKIVNVEIEKTRENKIYFVFYFDEGSILETNTIELEPSTVSVMVNNIGSSGDSGLLVDIACDSSVSVGSWVYLDDTGTAYNGKADLWSTSNVIGIVLSKPTETKCNIKCSGVTTDIFTGLTPGVEYVLSMDDAGEMVTITNGPAKNSTGVLYKLGTALTAKRLEISKGTRIGRT